MSQGPDENEEIVCCYRNEILKEGSSLFSEKQKTSPFAVLTIPLRLLTLKSPLLKLPCVWAHDFLGECGLVKEKLDPKRSVQSGELIGLD